MRALHAWLNDQQVGTLREGDDLWQFEYASGWMQAPHGFDLSPALGRAEGLHQDGGTLRPVQWYFDNLLPEETLRDALIRESGIKGDDAFALLEYLGAESAGSLVLLPPGVAPPAGGGLKPLADGELSQRIRDLPRQSLSTGAPKRMSVAGAQHKLLVVLRDGQLYEPAGNEPSTHLLKPDHLSDDYAASVINEYAMQRLGAALGLGSPRVYRRYVPEPVYLIERFDRLTDADGQTQRLHVIDACQLLNKSRNFKNTAASLQTLADCIRQCRSRNTALLRLYRWLVFNLLIGNDDNHLKNVSFRVSAEGVDLAPPYDMLATSVYRTRVIADERATWPDVDLMIPLPGATKFGQVTRRNVIEAGEMLGLPGRLAERELGRMAAGIQEAMATVRRDIEADNHALPEAAKVFLGGEMRVLRAIEKLVLPFMLARVAS
ncbi:MAG: HipA domain-containing protein [Polaromonas sp.]|nr:HipA domain-containing protein [Polaromonas sp.]